MRLSSLRWVCLLAVSLCLGCKKDDPKPGDVPFALSAASVALPAVGGSMTTEVTASGAWEATRSATWFVVTPPNASGNRTVSIGAAANTTGESRGGTVSFDNNGTVLMAAVNQAGGNLSVSPAAFTFIWQQNAATINITASGPWTLSTNANWLIPNITSGTGNATVTVQVTSNVSDQTRSGALTITSGGSTQVAVVNQGANPNANQRVTVSFYKDPVLESNTVKIYIDGTLRGELGPGSHFATTPGCSNAKTLNLTNLPFGTTLNYRADFIAATGTTVFATRNGTVTAQNECTSVRINY